MPSLTMLRLGRIALLAAACALTTRLSAQLAWTVFNETTSVAAPASTPTSGVVVTVPAGQRVTLVATNFVPVDLSAAGTEIYATVNFKVSGGLSSIGSGTRAIGFGMYNNATTATNYADDGGYFTWLNGRATGSLIELRRRNGDGTSASLLNPTGTAFVSLGTGTATQTAGALSDGNNYSIQLHLMGRSGGVSLGNTSSTTTGAGIWVSGDGLSQTAFTNPDLPPVATVFNEIGFMFLNTTNADVTLTVNSLTGLTSINPPAVATQPAAIIVNPGQPATFTVGATGTAPLTYQWKKDGTNITGATSASYTVANPQTADAGSYTVTITNAYGTATSNGASLTVTSAAVPATITSQPVGITVNAGADATFSVTAFGSAPLAYQWKKDGTNITGATSASYTVSKAGAADAGSYTVVVSNTTSTVTSSAAVLSVNTAPTITTQPVSVTSAAGQNVTFSVTAAGSPAPTYQWARNGTNITGATSSTLTLSNITLANTGVYTVRVTNSVGAVSSNAAVLAIPSAMTATAVTPANGTTGVNTDATLSVTFDRAPTIGTTGRIRIFRASDDTVVDTLDLGTTPYTRKIGTQSVDFIFYPIIVTGNTAAIYPHAGVLAYGQTYYVQMEQSTILDSTGASFTGINDKTSWRFTTKAAGPAADATAVTVAADGSGDFSTVQGAIDFVPVNNSKRVVITVKKGTYTEICYVGTAKPFVTIRGEDRANTIIQYANNNNFNTLTGNNRVLFGVDASDFTLETITLKNTTPQGGSQAEAFRGNAVRILLNRVNLLSRQDTLLINGTTCTAFVTDSYIEGNTDFMWGSGAVYIQRCELKALDTGTATEGYYTQIRNGATGLGNVYVDCRLTVADGVVGKSTYFLGRIDPNTGNFPYSQAVYLNCAMGPHINAAGWQLNNATTSATVQDWEYRSTDLNGGLLDVSKRLSSSRQISETEANLYRNPAYVLGGWVPQIAPTIETSPAAQTVNVGANAKLTVVANGYPVPSIQWFKNGVALLGATDATLVLPNVQTTDAANYTATVSSVLGSVTSSPAALTVGRGKYAGTYFGALGSSPAGTYALYVRDDSTGVFLGQLGTTTIVNRTVIVDGTGKFTFANGSTTITGTIDASGNITGTPTLTGARSAAGSTAAYAGYYQTGANGAAATTSIIVGGAGQAYAFVQNGATVAAGSGTVSTAGVVSVTAGSTTVTSTIASTGGSASTTITGSSTTQTGVNDLTATAQRIRQFSNRARVDGSNSATVGFVVTGDTADSFLIRAIGPTLADAFAVTPALSNPKLDIYRSGVLLASNTNWITSNTSEIALAGAQSGAFPLRATLADSAIRLALSPGAYTAVMSSANGATSGVGLLEVYDLSGGNAGQRLVNYSAGGNVSAGVNTLIAGLAVSGSAPKRLLVRAVGPSLAQFNVSNPLAKPILALYRGGTLVATNTGVGTSADAAAITSTAGDVGAFALTAGAADSALLINLAPGAYTAQVSSADGGTGFALIEFYEVP